tara:strand:+ start:17652 stop:17945 length:294 start_codon:yes stop_codon:yes gene_type:complete
MINVVLGWYGYKLLQKALLYADNIVFLHEDADDFLAHIEAVYEMETFYGDETLRALVLHSREFRDQIEEFKQNSVLEIEDEDTEELIIYGNTKTEEG